MSVLSRPEILACAVPVLLVENRPIFEMVFLDVFPTSVEGTSQPEARARCLLSRELLHCFGGGDVLCEFVAFSEGGQIVSARLLPVEQAQRDRLAEVHEAVAFLAGYDLTYAEGRVQAAQRTYRATFCYPVPSLGTIVPSGRSPLFSYACIRRLTVDHERLIDREARAAQQAPADVPDIDLFVSYCHLDAAAASRIANWIATLWPDVRLFISDPEDAAAPRTTRTTSSKRHAAPGRCCTWPRQTASAVPSSTRRSGRTPTSPSSPWCWAIRRRPDSMPTLRRTRSSASILAPSLWTPNARDRLILLLETLEQEAHWRAVLDTLPALVDRELVHRIDKRAALRELNGEQAAADRLARTQGVVLEHIEVWAQALEVVRSTRDGNGVGAPDSRGGESDSS